MTRPNPVRSFVGNAGDPKQVKRGDELEKFARQRRLNGWRYLLATALGRELAWNLLKDCNVFVSIVAQSSVVIYANAGRHDWGLQMMAEMIEASEDHYLLMQKEAMARDRTIPEVTQRNADEDDPDA